jgi:hypothetical protein
MVTKSISLFFFPRYVFSSMSYFLSHNFVAFLFKPYQDRVCFLPLFRTKKALVLEKPWIAQFVQHLDQPSQLATWDLRPKLWGSILQPKSELTKMKKGWQNGSREYLTTKVT